MPIPDKPYTRREAYLNAAATGDPSGIPETPYTREEMYLDAIAKGGGGGGGSSTLAGLTDVDISNPTDGQTLVYNSTSGKWENGAGGGGGVLVLHVVEISGTDDTRLDKTWQEIWNAQMSGTLVATISEYTETGYVSMACTPILNVAADTDRGYWDVISGDGISFRCLAPTDYPQTGIYT